jgi:predicted Mrr-cat superfamily restriction endonuclease
MRVWRLITHHGEPDRALGLYRRGFIALGWGGIGDLREHRPADPVAIQSAIRRTYPDLSNEVEGSRSLWGFWQEMALGDYVILSTGKKRAHVMRVSGEYYWMKLPHPTIGDYQHRRPAESTLENPDALWNRSGGMTDDSWNIRWALIRCRDISK